VKSAGKNRFLEIRTAILMWLPRGFSNQTSKGKRLRYKERENQFIFAQPASRASKTSKFPKKQTGII